MMNDSILLWTHGPYDDVAEDGEQGICFKVKKSWLAHMLPQYGYTDLLDFLRNYSWDETEEILFMAEGENEVLYKKCSFSGDVVSNLLIEA